MYRFEEKQLSFTDFNQPQGLQMNPENRWIKKAEMIPWDTIEKEYAKLFPSRTGMPAKPLRMALGSLLIQKQYHYPDEELVEQIRENPYYQYFIGMPGYEDKIPFVPSLLVEFRKRLSEDVLNEINEMIIEYNAQKSDDDNDGNDGDDSGSNDTDSTSDSSENSGTLILDATCAPQNIKYPQDIELLNETREKLEDMLCRISDEYGFYRPRMYKEKARKDYLALAKCRKRGAKKIRKAIKKQLQYIRRDLGYMDNLLENNNVILSASDAELLDILTIVYEQQQYMFENNTHTVENRILRTNLHCSWLIGRASKSLHDNIGVPQKRTKSYIRVKCFIHRLTNRSQRLLLLSMVQFPELQPMPTKTAHKSLIGLLSLGFSKKQKRTRFQCFHIS